MFQAAVSYASKELNVTFICQKAITSLPRCVHGMPQPDTKTLSTLKFLYLSTEHEVVDYCSTMHLKTVLPDILIVADIHCYFGHGQAAHGEHTAARMLALLKDTIEFIKKKSASTQCKLIVSCNDYIKWINSVATKFSYQILKITEPAELVGRMEWEELDSQHILTFKTDGNQLFLDKISVQGCVKS